MNSFCYTADFRVGARRQPFIIAARVATMKPWHVVSLAAIQATGI